MTKAKTKKAAKKAQGHWGNQAVGGVLGQAPRPKPFTQALREFDAALVKVENVRAVLMGAVAGDVEVTAYRASKLQRLAHEVSTAAHYLEQSAIAEAEK